MLFKDLLNENVNFIIITDCGVLSSTYDPVEKNKCGSITFTMCEKQYKIVNIFVLFNQGMTPELIRQLFKKFAKRVHRSFKIIEKSGFFEHINESYQNWIDGESESYIEQKYYTLDENGIQMEVKI